MRCSYGASWREGCLQGQEAEGKGFILSFSSTGGAGDRACRVTQVWLQLQV